MTETASIAVDRVAPANTAIARATLYNCLAAAFGDPPTARSAAAWAKMQPSLPAAPLEDVQRAYTALLVGPGQGYVPPYASIYLHPAESGKRQLWGPAAEAVEALYTEAGLAIAPGQPRVPDHLALELQFMQHLCAREADAEVRGDVTEAGAWRERQQAFLRVHLWPWLPRFASRLADAATAAHPIYRGLTRLLLAFVHSDLDAPGSPLEPVRPASATTEE